MVGSIDPPHGDVALVSFVVVSVTGTGSVRLLLSGSCTTKTTCGFASDERVVNPLGLFLIVNEPAPGTLHVTLIGNVAVHGAVLLPYGHASCSTTVFIVALVMVPPCSELELIVNDAVL